MEFLDGEIEQRAHKFKGLITTNSMSVDIIDRAGMNLKVDSALPGQHLLVGKVPRR